MGRKKKVAETVNSEADNGIFVMNQNPAKNKYNLKPIDRKFTNTFVDDLTECKKDLKVKGTAKKIDKNKTKVKKIKVVCDTCGKEDLISPALHRPDGLYKCNGCCVGKGRNRR